ncbi:flippase [Mucilaginibacter robiniae]|uniref:Flippase n=1 Tax=Mucilaginibacter robiniae TaxID=2728022 RepID=A0A7L5E2N6_9SPHI|nr:flippase [Mucilaginibacter robiniae]QJD97552.1 flippase [Mucilaginibacter robiniae]
MKKNYIYNLLLTVFNILFPILSFPYASRILGPTGIGKFQFITSFAQYFILVSNLGIPTYGTREIAKYKGNIEKQSKVFSELITIAFIMSMALTVIYVSVIGFLTYFQADRQLYLTAAVSVFLGFTTIDWLYTGLEEFRMIAIRSVAVKLISLILLYVFVKDSTDVIIYLYIGIFSSVANNAYNMVTVQSKVKITFKSLNLVQHIKPLLLIFGLYVATSMYTLLDVVLLGFLADPQAVGLYSAAVKLSKIAIPFVTSVGAVTLPKMAHQFATKNYNELQGLLDKSLHFILFFSIPSFVGLALLAPEFITLFSGKQFMAGTLSMQILALLPVLIGLGYFWGLQILIPAGRDKEMVYSVVGGMIVAISLNFLLVPKFRDVGASIANVVTELVVTLLYIYFVKKSYSFKFKWDTAYKATLTSLLFIPIVIAVRKLNISMPIITALSIIGCGATYLLVQWLVFKDHLVEQLYQSFLIKLKLKKIEAPE